MNISTEICHSCHSVSPNYQAEMSRPLGLCSREEGYNFSDAEQSEAIKLLDKNGDRLIQFTEFVDWWQNAVSTA